MIRIGLLSFSDGRERVHRSLVPAIEESSRRLRKTLEESGEAEVVCGDEIIWRHAQAREQAKALAARETDGTILNVPVFAFPNLVRIAAVKAQPPFLAFSPVFGGLPGLGGLLGAASGLEQSGVPCEKVYGSPDDPATVRALLTFCRAAHAVNGLKGSVLGLIGGRSVGMVTGESCPDLYYAAFGLDVDHLDQSEILRRAALVPDDEVERAFQWLKSRVGTIAFDGRKLTPESLKDQIRHYAATKDIVEERQFDFAAVKCHTELSEYYVTQCLSAALMNDPYDWTGEKAPVVFACEADADGAVTMQILKLISGKPVAFADLRHYDEADHVMAFCNCGGLATWYARRSADPGENLKEVALVPVLPKYGGAGGHVRFMAGEGPMTFARLFHRAGRFSMTIFQAELERVPEARMEVTCSSWPHLFARLSTPVRELIPRLGSNHVHGAAGDHRAALMKFCDLTGVKAEVF